MKKIFSILFITTLLITGCSEDFLYRKSLTALADDTFWSTEADAEMALAGCYSNLQSPWIYDSDPWAAGAIRYDYMSDNGWVRWGWEAGGDLSRGEHSTSSWIIGSKWNELYQAIVRCNRVIDMVPTLGEEIISASTAAQIVAEAKFIRALIYNELTMTYTDVPLIKEIQPVEEADIAKSAKSDIVNFILTDLEGCVEDLADPGAVDWGRATKGAGYALLARINLYNENWSDAATWAQKVIDLNYSLYPDFHGLFQSANEINDEVIFPVRFVRGPDEDGANHSGYWGTAVVNHNEVLPNLAEDYFCVDGKPIAESPLYNPDVPAENRDPRFDATILSNGANWRGAPLNTFSKTWTGYAQRKYTEEQNSENHFDANEDFYVFRLGEVLLMKAEAVAESGGSSTEIFALINQLRDRVSVQMPHVDQAEVDNYFGGSIVQMVRHERRIETAFEGLRYFDLVRWGLLKERSFDYYMNNEKANDNRLSDRRWPGNKQYKWPIPQSEIDVNELLEQHSEWN
jgi:starch-binding outer membrane protein, SusD/RagB family